MYNKKLFNKPFTHCEYYVEDFIPETENLQPVNMLGMVKEIKKIKQWLQDNFTNVNYMTCDIEYHGWNGETAKNMHEINDYFTTLMLQMYVVCCKALGESPYQEEENNAE